VLGLAGCGGGGSHPASTTASSTAPAASAAPTVAIANYAYAPPTLTVKAGTKVTFVNHDATAHTATAAGVLRFDTGTLKAGASGSVTLTKPGSYSYICQFHPFMKATITVTG
jgi:plastocyanin